MVTKRNDGALERLVTATDGAYARLEEDVGRAFSAGLSKVVPTDESKASGTPPSKRFPIWLLVSLAALFAATVLPDRNVRKASDKNAPRPNVANGFSTRT